MSFTNNLMTDPRSKGAFSVPHTIASEYGEGLVLSLHTCHRQTQAQILCIIDATQYLSYYPTGIQKLNTNYLLVSKREPSLQLYEYTCYSDHILLTIMLYALQITFFIKHIAYHATIHVFLRFRNTENMGQ